VAFPIRRLVLPAAIVNGLAPAAFQRRIGPTTNHATALVAKGGGDGADVLDVAVVVVMKEGVLPHREQRRGTTVR